MGIRQSYDLMLGDNEQLRINGQLRPGCRLKLFVGGGQPVTSGYRMYMQDTNPNNYLINGFDRNGSFKLNENGELVKIPC